MIPDSREPSSRVAGLRSRRRIPLTSGFWLLASGFFLVAATGCPPPPPPPRPSPSPSPTPSPSPKAAHPEDGPEIPAGNPGDPENRPDEKGDVAAIDSARAAAILARAKESGVITAFPHMKVFLREKRIEVEGVTSLKVGPQLELLACSPRGKSYESLLVWLCEPAHFHLALLFLGLEPTPQIQQFGQPATLTKGQKVVIEVEWKDPKAGETVRRRAEDLLFDNARDGAMKRAGWVFTGSRLEDVLQPPHWDTTKKVYAAQATGTICVTYHDPDAILDTPLSEGGNNTLFVAWSERLPERHTPCTIHVRPWREGDDQEPADAKRPANVPRPPGGGPPGG